MQQPWPTKPSPITNAVAALTLYIAAYLAIIGPVHVVLNRLITDIPTYDPWQRLALVIASLPFHLLAIGCAYLSRRTTARGDSGRAAAYALAGVLALLAAIVTYWLLAAFFPALFPGAYR